MNKNDKFIGGGIIFPIEINEAGRVNKYTGTPLIRASILHILNWPIAHSYFNERFGSRLEECLEEPSDGVTMTVMKRFIIESLDKWDRRVTPINIKLEYSEDRSIILLRLHYRIVGTRKTDTFIFPFYKDIIY